MAVQIKTTIQIRIVKVLSLLEMQSVQELALGIQLVLLFLQQSLIAMTFSLPNLHTKVGGVISTHSELFRSDRGRFA